MTRSCDLCQGPLNDQGICWNCFKRPKLTEKDFEPFFELDTRSDWEKLSDLPPRDRLRILGLAAVGFVGIFLGTEVLENDVVMLLGMATFFSGVIYSIVAFRRARSET